MDRVLQATAPTATESWYDGDGTIVDPGAVTLTIDREDGTNVVTAAATTGTGAAARSYNLTTTQTASLDILKLTWTSATLGTLVSYVEVVGGFLFTLAQARADSTLTSTTGYATADIVTARTLAEDALEHECGVAFVPRYGRDRFDGNGGTDINVPPRLLSVASVSYRSSLLTTAFTAAQLAALELYEDGRLYNPSGWTIGRRNVEVKYTHGYQFPPPRVGRAALLLARRWLVETPISDRATSLHSADGSSQYFVTAGMRGMVFDIPEANACVDLYGLKSVGP